MINQRNFTYNAVCSSIIMFLRVFSENNKYKIVTQKALSLYKISIFLNVEQTYTDTETKNE